MCQLVPLRLGFKGMPAAKQKKPEVGLYQLNAVDPQLETTRFQPLNPSSEKLISSLCFQIQLVPLRRVQRHVLLAGDHGGGAAGRRGSGVRRGARAHGGGNRRASVVDPE